MKRPKVTRPHFLRLITENYRLAAWRLCPAVSAVSRCSAVPFKNRNKLSTKEKPCRGEKNPRWTKETAFWIEGQGFDASQRWLRRGRYEIHPWSKGVDWRAKGSALWEPPHQPPISSGFLHVQWSAKTELYNEKIAVGGGGVDVSCCFNIFFLDWECCIKILIKYESRAPQQLHRKGGSQHRKQHTVPTSPSSDHFSRHR